MNKSNKLIVALTVLAMLVVSAALMLGGCQPQEVDLAFETIERADFPRMGQDYEGKEPRLIIVAEAGEISALGNSVSLDARVQLQNLDFSQYFAVAVFQGWRGELPTPQSGVEVQRISRRGSTITIYAQFYEPVEGYERKPVEISPYHLVKMRKEGHMQGEFEFVLNVDGTDVARQAHLIP